MPSSSRSRPGKTALVLAGGGLTGAVYEIGALRAMNDLLVDMTVNDFDIYVGTSAGALVASVLANGLSPEAMLQAIAGSHPELPPLEQRDLFHFNVWDWLRWSARLPQTAVGAWSHYLRHRADMSLLDVVVSLSEALPAGLYDNLALERYMRRALKQYGQSNRFADLAADLFIVATDLDSGQRAVFGRDTEPAVPISLAIAASTALPVFYKPVRIHGHDYVDGGVRGNASLDVAIEHGATLIVCINPMVPFDNSDRQAIPFLGPNGGFLSDKGISAITSQVTRIHTNASLHYHLKQLRKTHPEVDVILIEPDRYDYQMAFYNIMRYSARLMIARNGFEKVTLKLAEDHAHYEALLNRHGIALNRRFVMEELEEIKASNYDPETIRRILEARPVEASEASSPTASVQTLHSALDDLESWLGEVPPNTETKPNFAARS